MILVARRIKDNAPTAHQWAVNEHLVEARALIEIGPNDPWKRFESGDYKVHANVKGAIIKVVPPASATDETIDRLRTVLIEAGALTVRVMPRPKGAVIPAGVEVKTKKPAHRSVREVVLQLTKEANSKDHAALKTIVEETMSKVGL